MFFAIIEICTCNLFIKHDAQRKNRGNFTEALHFLCIHLAIFFMLWYPYYHRSISDFHL